MQVRGCGGVALACLQVRKSEATIWCCIGPRSTNGGGSARPPSRGIAGKWQLLQISFLLFNFFTNYPTPNVELQYYQLPSDTCIAS